MFGVSAAAVVGVGSVIATPTSTASLIKLESTDTTISYEVDTNFEDENLILVLENDFTNRTIELKNGLNEGVFSGLSSDMYYTFEIRTTDSLIDKEILKTEIRILRKEKIKETIFYSVEYECKCNIDGCFHFKMDFIDENNYYSNFKATLVDKNGNEANCVFTADLKAEQTIDVIGNNLVGNRAIFTISCLSYENSEIAELIILYQVEVKI